MIVVIGGLPKSGTSWYNRMVNALLHEAGAPDPLTAYDHPLTRSIVASTQGYQIGYPSPMRLMRLLAFGSQGYSAAFTTHLGPSQSLQLLGELGLIKLTSIHRDPRDTVLSAMDHGSRCRAEKNIHEFAELLSVRDGALHMKERIAKWRPWLDCPKALNITYENLLANPIEQMTEVVQFLGLSLSRAQIEKTVSRYDRSAVNKSTAGSLHLNKGVARRYETEMSTEELNICQDILGEYIQAMAPAQSRAKAA